MNEIALVATGETVVRFDAEGGRTRPASGLDEQHPTGIAADPHTPGRAWCCTRHGGVFRTDDTGRSWVPSGLEGVALMSLVFSPSRPDLIWAGSEPSAVWRSDDGGRTWDATSRLEALPSSSGWAFPPRPETHHVRWIGCHPSDERKLWVAIEAGALVRSDDGGVTWRDRVPGGPYDTHELVVTATEEGDVVRSAAGDGYHESRDGGDSWVSPREGLEITYLRSVATDPGDPRTVLVSGATGPRSAYVRGRSDGRVYRREGGGAWVRVEEGWPSEPSTIAPLLVPGRHGGEFYAADERGVHRSSDGGRTWKQVWSFSPIPTHLRGLAILF